jgi:glutamine---fructose-6-phosphate transaminase (isomerizing)
MVVILVIYEFFEMHIWIIRPASIAIVKTTIAQVKETNLLVCFEDCSLNTVMVSRSPLNERIVNSSDVSMAKLTSRSFLQYFSFSSSASSSFGEKLLIDFLVGPVGVEPTCPFGPGILSPLRKPVPPQAHWHKAYCLKAKTSTVVRWAGRIGESRIYCESTTMCGIVGYIGKGEALPVLINGLKALEYRGYDSAGVAVFANDHVEVRKRVGQVNVLETSLKDSHDFDGHLGIGHTRWATHGVPSEANAHPHTDCSKRVFAVHNGIIENYKELKQLLQSQGHVFTSETDTEVVPHLIESFLNEGKDFDTALFDALKVIKGAYALVIIDAKNPGTLYAAKLSSPLIIGVGDGENFLASDPSALVGKTQDVIYLNDGEVAKLREDGVSITNLEKQETPCEIVRLEWNLEQAQKGDFPHFMLKEIFEGPEVIRSAFRGRIHSKEHLIKLGGLEQVADKLKDVKRLLILACGTSYYAGLVGEYLFEEIAKIPTEVHFASEFRYRDEPFDPGTAVIAISQSGETADTLAAIQKAKEHGLMTLGIVNTVGSTIARDTDAGVYNHAGPEIGVASTKAFLSQLTVLTLMAMYLSKDASATQSLMEELEKIPEKIQSIVSQSAKLEELAKKYKDFENFLFIGRRYNYPVALEGALKLKEISYLHAEGYGAGEMKHGPIAMISPDFPTMAIVPQNSVSEKMFSNLEEIKARRGPIFAIATEGDEKIASLANDVFYVPKTIEALEPLLTVVPLQLFAYYIGTERGFDVDKPRNLAKSVTVE